jgi:hypothetical protein
MVGVVVEHLEAEVLAKGDVRVRSSEMRYACKREQDCHRGDDAKYWSGSSEGGEASNG